MPSGPILRRQHMPPDVPWGGGCVSGGLRRPVMPCHCVGEATSVRGTAARGRRLTVASCADHSHTGGKLLPTACGTSPVLAPNRPDEATAVGRTVANDRHPALPPFTDITHRRTCRGCRLCPGALGAGSSVLRRDRPGEAVAVGGSIAKDAASCPRSLADCRCRLASCLRRVGKPLSPQTPDEYGRAHDRRRLERQWFQTTSSLRGDPRLGCVVDGPREPRRRLSPIDRWRLLRRESPDCRATWNAKVRRTAAVPGRP